MQYTCINRSTSRALVHFNMPSAYKSGDEVVAVVGTDRQRFMRTPKKSLTLTRMSMQSTQSTHRSQCRRSRQTMSLSTSFAARRSELDIRTQTDRVSVECLRMQPHTSCNRVVSLQPVRRTDDRQKDKQRNAQHSAAWMLSFMHHACTYHFRSISATAMQRQQHTGSVPPICKQASAYVALPQGLQIHPSIHPSMRSISFARCSTLTY